MDDQLAQIHDDLHVIPGRTVDVEYVRTGRVGRYVVVDQPPSLGTAIVSAASPIGRELIGRSAGDVVAVSMPAGYVEDLRILCVRRAGDEP